MPILRGVREKRREAGVKSGALAAQLGCSRSHLISIENGNRPASFELANLIAKALNVDVGELLPAPDGGEGT